MQQPDKNIKHRSRIELIASILGAAASVPEGELSTRIMYRGNASQKDLKKYFGNLSNSELLEYDSHSRRYKVTSKGNKLLELYSRLRQELRGLE
jgi:predicted transcriptional regulator